MIAMLAVSIPAVLLADKWGRRSSTIFGGIALCSIMFLIGGLYAAQAVHPYGAARWAVVVSVYLFGMTYCSTWGIVGKIYASEIQPSHTRGAANSVGMAMSYFTNWLVALITPILLSASAFGAYFLFGGLALFTVCVLTLSMPETKGRSLENIQEAFQQPASSQFMRVIGLFRRGQAATGEPALEADAVELQTHAQEAPATASASSVSITTGTRSSRLELVAA
jgi:MFS family permease